MRTRGRPRHPETLTPRQQEVLALLRRALTNDEIAASLDITVDGVKYHVAEVLRRLGVRDRYDAALVESGVERRSWFAGLLALPLVPKLKLHALGYAAGAVVIAAAGVAIVLFALAVGSTDTLARNDALAARLAEREIVAYKTGDKTWKIGFFDAVAMQQVASFTVGSPGEPPRAAVIAGDRVVVNYGSRLVSYAIDGTGERTLFSLDEGFVHGIAASPEGDMLALTFTTADHYCVLLPDGRVPSDCGRSWGDITEVAVIEAATGHELLRIPQSDARFDGLTGQASLPVWRSPEVGAVVPPDPLLEPGADTPQPGPAFVVSGITQGEAPGNRALVQLDGAVQLNGPLDYHVPNNGIYMVTGSIQPCPNLNLRRHQIMIVEIATGRVVAEVSEDDRVFFPHAFSPDSTELLYFTQAYPGGPDDTSCTWDDATTEWSILALDGSVTSNVNLHDVQRRWYGSGAVTFTCPETVSGPCIDAQYAETASVNGHTIATGPDIRILGPTSPY